MVLWTCVALIAYRRAESHKAVYDGAKAMLLQRLPLLSTDALLRLLDASFAYIEVKDLQDIPLKVLEHSSTE